MATRGERNRYRKEAANAGRAKPKAPGAAARANAGRSVAGLRRAGRIGPGSQGNHVGTAGAGPLAAGNERGATARELSAMRRGQNVGGGSKG